MTAGRLHPLSWAEPQPGRPLGLPGAQQSAELLAEALGAFIFKIAFHILNVLRLGMFATEKRGENR